MSAREIVLDGGSPWGFRMHGGADVCQPLRISRVNPGSKAALKGIREGDVISSINGQPTRSISNSDAHALLRNAGQTLHLGLNEECSGSPKRRIHRNVQQESKSESVKRSTVTKTTTTVRTTPVNGAADPNANSQFSDKGDLKEGQNGGVKEISTGSTSDSKGQRRRRRQQSTPQHELSGDAKEDSDTITDRQDASKTLLSPTFSEGGGSKSRRRRRSRGNNRRKCRVGSALGVEGGVSGTELKVGEQEKEISTTEPETDATMSDVGAKSEECVSHGGDASKADTVEEVSNNETKEEVTFKNVQLTNANAFFVDVNKKSVLEVGDENELTLEVLSFAGKCVGTERGRDANVASVTSRNGNLLDDFRKRYIPDVGGWNETSERVREGGVKPNHRDDVGVENSGFEDKVIELNDTETGSTQADSASCAGDTLVEGTAGIRECERIQKIIERNSKSKFASQEIVTEALREKDGANVDVGRLDKGEKISEEKDGCEREAPSLCETACEDLVLETGGNIQGVDKGRTEFLINDETGAGVEGSRSDFGDATESPLIPEVSKAGAESRNENVSETEEKVEMHGESDCSRGTEMLVSRRDRVTEEANIQRVVTECSASHAVNDTSDLKFIQHASENTQEHVKEFVSLVKNVNTVRSAAGTAVTGEVMLLDGNEIGQNTGSEYCYGNSLHLSSKTTAVLHGTDEQAFSNETCGHGTDKHSSETVILKTHDYDCSSLAELRKGESNECQDCRDLAAENDLQSKLSSDIVNENETVTTGTRNSAPAGEVAVRYSEISAEGDKCSTKSQRKEAYSISEQPPIEYRAVVSGGEEVWEEVEELYTTEAICKDKDGRMPGGEEGCPVMSNTSTFLKSDKLSQEEKELLDTIPVIDEDDEATLRRFLHSLNLADYSQEAVRTRNAILRDGSTEEVYATRKAKRRAPLETYSSQQRGLDVIVEENSSDYSDGEKRVDERRGKAWEEAIFIPETNQVVFLRNDRDKGEYQSLDNRGREESRFRNTSICYSETKVMSYDLKSGESIRRFCQREGNEARSTRTRVVSEDVGIDIFSEDMENALESAGDTAECDSEDGREDVSKACVGGEVVKVELAESSEDEDDVKVTWTRGRAREMQDIVEIVYLEEDSGSTSSGSCIAAKKVEGEAAGDSVEEEDPDAVYEVVEFPVRLGGFRRITGAVQEESSESNPADVIYENTEFHRNTETVFKTQQTETDIKTAGIPDNLQESPQCSAVNESSDIYEDIEFVREQISPTSRVTCRQYNLSVSVACGENDLIHLADTSDAIHDSKSRPNDNMRDCRGNNDQDRVRDQMKTTKYDDPSDIEREKVANVSSEAKFIRQSECVTEFSGDSESRVQSDDIAGTDHVSKTQRYEGPVPVTSPVAKDEQRILQHKDGVNAHESANVDDAKINGNSKTDTTGKQITSSMPQRENVGTIFLGIIKPRLISGISQVESLKENALEVTTVEKDYGQEQERNGISTKNQSDIDSGTKMYCDTEPTSSDEIERDSEPKRAENDVCLKSHQSTPETNTNIGGDTYVKRYGKDDECLQTPDRSLLSLPHIDSHIKIQAQSTNSRQVVYNLKTETVKCNLDLKLTGSTHEKNTGCGTETCIAQEKSDNISGEFGNVRDEEDGFDDLDSVTPTNRSPHGSSSSDAGSHGTAVYCPGRFSPQSSDADISSYAEDNVSENKPLRKIYSHQSVCNKLQKSRSHENILDSKKYLGPSFKNATEIRRKVHVSPKTLTDLCIEKVLSLPHGVDILNVLGIHVREDGKNLSVKTLMLDAVKSFQLLNSQTVSATYTSVGKFSLSGSLSGISSTQQEVLSRDQPSSINIMKSSPLHVSSPRSLAESDWVGMPTKEDPNLLVCLSPSQRQSYQQGESPTPEEADNLLDLHCKFIQRRGYNENPPSPPSRRVFGMHRIYTESHITNWYPSDKCLPRDTDYRPRASAGHYAESEEETSAVSKHILSPRFRAVLTSLDSKIPFKGNTRSVMDGLKDAQVEEKRELGVKENDYTEDGGGEKERGRSSSRSRLLAILRASSESQETQAKHLSPSSSCSPPPLPPLPSAYQHHFDMLGFLQQNRRPTSFCCTSNDNDFDYLLQHGPPRSPSYKNNNLCDNSLQSPTLPIRGGGKTPSWSSSIEGTGNKKERALSWYGQGASDGNEKERLKVKSLADWLHLVRRGGSSKDSDRSGSKDPTPQVSACVSTQSSPGPIRRDMKDPSPNPETNRSKESGVKEHQKLKQQILERRFSLPDRQLEQTYQPEHKLIKPPLLPTSARDDERHEQQLRLLQQRQQRFRNQQLPNKTEQTQDKRPPLPQQQSKQKQAEPEAKTQGLCNGHAVSEQKEPATVLQERQQVERRFDADNYRISKKGDIAIINSNATSRTQKEEESILRSKENEDTSRLFKSSQRPKSMPTPFESLVTSGEIFRQQMYVEYMDKVAERAERRRHKVIRLSSVPREDVPTSETQDAASTAVQQLENEFMGRVRERMDKLGLKYDEESDDGNKMESGADNCYVISGGSAEEMGGGGASVIQLPKHLQEFLAIAGGTGSESDVDGVWSPSLKPSADVSEVSKSKKNQDNNAGEDAPPVVWTPKSAGASPTSERKEFRPVNFESPTLSRKNRSATFAPPPFKPADDFQPAVTTSPVTQESTTTTTFSSIFPPWQQQHSRDDSVLSVGSSIHSPTSDKSVASSTITSTLDRRLVQSQSAPASGLSALAAGGSSNIKLPRAQNPTITLLQKAREGQLPRGALYLDHKMNSKEAEKPYVSPNDILYTVKKEYESEGEKEQRKKIVELGPRKYEGIGPTTKEGIPIVLRSEVKDANQGKWYKRMYDSLHRAGKDDEYITIRYKPRRGHYPYTSPGGYLSEPEPALYDSDIGYSAKYATLDRRRIKNKENDFTTSTLPRSRYVPHPASIKYATDVYKNQPGRIEDYEPGHSSISEKETKQWWDEVLDIFDGQTNPEPRTTPSTPSNKPFMTYALKESGYESDSTLVFKRRDENLQNQLSPAEQKLAYKTIQKGGEVPLHGLRKPAPERPKESPHRYVESEVTIHYRSPVRSEAKEALSEEELARRQAEAMRRIYQEERRRKYLQELQDMHSRRHTDNFTPSQKSPIPLNRYDDFLDDVGNKGKPRDRTPEPKLVARALYNFVGQTSRELSFRRGDVIFVRRQIDKNWYEGEHNAMIGLFPFNYVEIIPYDGIRTIPKRPSEGQARAKFNFFAQTHLELSLVKGELVVLTRRVDDNWFEGRIGNRKGIFPVSYVEVLSEPGEKPVTPVGPASKPITLPASHTVLMNGSGIRQSMGQHSYQPSSYYSQNKMTLSYTSSNPYATLPRQSQTMKQPIAPVNQTLHIDTHSEPVPYRALYNYRPQNEDELELREGDTVYVMEKCDDGWYVGSSQRTGYFGTFPGNYVERI